MSVTTRSTSGPGLRRVAVRRRAGRVPVPRSPATPGERVLVLSASVGQGHEGAARELARRLTARGVDVEVFDYLDALPWPARRVLRDLYHPTVQYAPRLFDWIFRGLERHGGLRSLARWVDGQAAPEIERRGRGADVVVSTYPLASQTLGRLRDGQRMAATAITYLTDPAAHALWCHASVDVHLTATHATAGDAARYGVDAHVAGPLCSPRFGRPGRPRHALREELGLPATAPVALLSAGSLGMGAIPRTVAAVLTHPQAWVVVLCGRNEALHRSLGRTPRVVPLGWREDVADLMASADVLIHNAGGLSFTEALVAGLPALTYLPIPGHGRANAALLEQAGVAEWPRTDEQLVDAIERAYLRPRPATRPWPAGADPVDAVERALAERTPAALRVSGF